MSGVDFVHDRTPGLGTAIGLDPRTHRERRAGGLHGRGIGHGDIAIGPIKGQGMTKFPLAGPSCAGYEPGVRVSRSIRDGSPGPLVEAKCCGEAWRGRLRTRALSVYKDGGNEDRHPNDQQQRDDALPCCVDSLNTSKNHRCVPSD